MMKRTLIILMLWVAHSVAAVAHDKPNNLTEAQTADGWELLWDGKTTKGWRSSSHEGFPEKGWEIKDGVLSVLHHDNKADRGGHIMTEAQYSHFILELDFRISAGANSGIKYFLDPKLLKDKGNPMGLEFQIIDENNLPKDKPAPVNNQSVGSLFGLITANSEKRVNEVGQWNRARLVVRGNQVEHWLNGIKIVEFDRGSEEYRTMVANSRFAKQPNYGQWEKTHIVLQDHGFLVSFRSIKIKNLK